MCLSRRRIAALFQSNGVIAGMRCQAEEKSETYLHLYWIGFSDGRSRCDGVDMLTHRKQINYKRSTTGESQRLSFYFSSKEALGAFHSFVRLSLVNLRRSSGSLQCELLISLQITAVNCNGPSFSF